ncbi:sugar porter family MFS transporter [Isosphaeraceae bacterium EP7]
MIAHEPRTDTGQETANGKLTPALIGSAMVAALGGLLFGFDTAVISGTTEALTSAFGLTSSTLGFTVASALIGTILGSVVAGRPTDRWGRKRALMVLAVGYFVASLGSALAWDWASFVAFRMLGGLAVGGASVVSPLYIAEISPARYRGRLVAIMQFNIVLGILAAFLSNYLIGRMNLGEVEWRWMLGIQAIPSAIFFGLLLPTPESPRWLIMNGRVDEARAVMAGLGVDAPEIDREVAEIGHSVERSRGEEDESLFQHKYRRPIFLAVAIALFNQLSGINALMYYAPTIFKMAGAGEGSALLQAVALGGTNLVFTMLAMTVIDRFGRRKLILIGSVGYLISLVATAWAFYTYGTAFTPIGSTIVLSALILFIASHAFGQGAVIWVFISEIFPNRVRARGQALGSFTHWVMAALVSWTFPIIAERSGGHAFAFYAAMMCLQLLWALFLMPETKGVPLEEIQARLGID